MNSIVQDLERLLLPQFRSFAERLGGELPNVKVNVRSQGFESRGGCHLFCIDCLIPDVCVEQPDNIGLSVEVYNVTSSPMMSADVCWGHPSGYVEDELSSEDGEFSEKAVAALRLALPHLIGSLDEAIKRGTPSGQIRRHA